MSQGTEESVKMEGEEDKTYSSNHVKGKMVDSKV